MKALRFLLGSSLLLFSSSPAFSGPEITVYDTSAASIVCTTLSGTVAPKPFLTLTPQPMVLTIKAKLSGCTVTGALPADPPLRIRSGNLSARLAVAGDASCATLIEGFHVAGSFLVKWKTEPGQALDFASSAFVPDTDGLVAGLVPVGMTIYGQYTTAGLLAAESAFAGAEPGLLVVSAEDVFTMLGMCCTDAMTCSPLGAGIKKLHFGLGQVQM